MIFKLFLTFISVAAGVFGFLNAGSEAGIAALGGLNVGTSLNGEVESRLLDQGFRQAVFASAERGEESFPAIDARLSERAEKVRVLRPLDPVPIRVLAVGRIAKSNPDLAQEILTASASIYKRDVASNMWLVQDFARRGQIDELIRYFDRALRTNREARTASMPAFVGLIAQPEGRARVARLVEGNPDWEVAFWSEFARNPIALENAAAFFDEGQISFADQPAELKLSIYSNLKKRRFFDTLFELADLDSGLGREATAGDLDAWSSVGSPIGWQLISAGLVSSRYDGTRDALVVEARPGAMDTFAERLMRKGSQSRLEVALADQVPKGMRMRVSAFCATDQTRVFAEILLSAGDRRASGQLADSEDCSFLILDASISVDRGSQGGEVAISRIHLS